MPVLGEWLFYTFLTTTLWTCGVYGANNNTVCASSQLDWYTDAVGETPCVTYQRLRQICNSDYQVGKFESSTPGDTCDDQLKDCCCNSVSWALSMLCMNCQYDTDGSGTSGIDAGDGAYEIYLGSCINNSVNQTLPKDVQSAVCNQQIKIDRNLYSLFWDTGAWFYLYTRDTIGEDLAATNNNTFTHCASTTRNTTTTKAGTGTATGSAKPQSTTSSQPQSGSNTAVVVGAAVGATVGAVALGLVGFCFWRQKRHARGPKPLDLSGEYQYKSETQPDQFGAITPFSAPSPEDLTSRGSPESTFGASAVGGASTVSTTALLGPGAFSTVGSTRASKFAGRDGIPPSVFAHDDEDERHQDGGPVTFLQRSASGRLPPAYQSWDEEPNDTTVAGEPSQSQSGVPSSVGAIPSGESSAAGSREPAPVPPPAPSEQRQYPQDAKRPLPS